MDALDVAAQMLHREIAKMDARGLRLHLDCNGLKWRAGFRAEDQLHASARWARQAPIHEESPTLLGLPFETDQDIPLDELRLFRGKELVEWQRLMFELPGPAAPRGSEPA